MDKEVNKVKFYYHKTSLVNNIFTVCTFYGSNNEMLSRGVSICSLLDTFEKKEGRRRSYSRAMRALHSEGNSYPINKRLSYYYIIRKLKIKSDSDLDKFETMIKPELIKYKCPIITIKNINGEIEKFIYKIPKNYPIFEASKFFTYKSEFKPLLSSYIIENIGHV